MTTNAVGMPIRQASHEPEEVPLADQMAATRRMELAAIRLASTISVIERITDDPSYPADRSDRAHESRRNDYYHYLAEFREASGSLASV